MKYSILQQRRNKFSMFARCRAALGVALLGGGLLWSAVFTQAATYQANNAQQLINAVESANASLEADVIELQPGEYVLQDTLVVRDDLDIRGPGTNDGCLGFDDPGKFTFPMTSFGSVSCDGKQGEDPGAVVIKMAEGVDRRVLALKDDGHNVRPSLTLRHLTVTGGRHTGGGSGGGGITIVAGDLGLYNVVVENNEVTGSQGAGIWIQSASANGLPNLIIANSTIRGNINFTRTGGVGVQASGGGLFITNDNSFNVIVGSTINGNYAGRGGGLVVKGRTILLKSTVSGNIAKLTGGGILHWGGGDQDSQLLNIKDSTITNNISSFVDPIPSEESKGPGIKLIVREGGFFGDAARAAIEGSFVLNNLDCGVRDPDDDCFGIGNDFSFQSLGGNVGSAGCGFSATPFVPVLNPPTGAQIQVQDTIPNIGPVLGLGPTSVCINPADTDDPVGLKSALQALADRDLRVFDSASGNEILITEKLADNGGPTQTHALAANSPAIKSHQHVISLGYRGPVHPVIAMGCPLDDQRDALIGLQLECDSGAYQTEGLLPDLGPEPQDCSNAPKWNKKKKYNAGAKVKHNGVLYEALVNIGKKKPSPDKNDNWKELGPCDSGGGNDGGGGSSPCDGVNGWNKKKKYNAGAEVKYKGSLYRALQNIPKKKPAPDKNNSWLLVEAC